MQKPRDKSASCLQSVVLRVPTCTVTGLRRQGLTGRFRCPYTALWSDTILWPRTTPCGLLHHSLVSDTTLDQPLLSDTTLWSDTTTPPSGFRHRPLVSYTTLWSDTTLWSQTPPSGLLDHPLVSDTTFRSDTTLHSLGDPLMALPQSCLQVVGQQRVHRAEPPRPRRLDPLKPITRKLCSEGRGPESLNLSGPAVWVSLPLIPVFLLTPDPDPSSEELD
ncbi:unnamed protein product [Arctogadus glacialis]